MGILEQILANQEEILTILKKTPVATAITPAPATAAEIQANPAEAAAAVAETPATPATPAATPAADVELDKEGQPWDERIHTKAKTKTVKQVWKLARGADKELVKQVQAENAAKYANAAAATPETPAATGGAPAPAAAPAPTAGAPAAAPAPTAGAPAANNAFEEFKKKAMEEMNKLQHVFKVDGDSILEVVEAFGVKLFSELKPEQYETVWTKFKAWADFLDLIQKDVDKIVGWYGESGQAQVTVLCQQYGVTTIGGVHHDEVAALYESVKTYREQCEAAQV